MLWFGVQTKARCWWRDVQFFGVLPPTCRNKMGTLNKRRPSEAVFGAREPGSKYPIYPPKLPGVRWVWVKNRGTPNGTLVNKTMKPAVHWFHFGPMPRSLFNGGWMTYHWAASMARGQFNGTSGLAVERLPRLLAQKSKRSAEPGGRRNSANQTS